MFKELFDKKKLIIFDLDGTVVKSEKAWESTYTEVARSLGFELTDPKVVSGRTVDDDWKTLIENNVVDFKKSIPELVKLSQDEVVKHLDKYELTEGFWPFVAELKLMKKLSLALTTNTYRTVTDKVIAELELSEVFDFIICGDEVKNPKPDPEIYKKTLAHFKVSPKEALAFEDSLTGCISAAKAGIKIICVWDGETPQRKFPDEVLDFTGDFTPFPGEMDTTYYEDIVQMAKEQEQAQKTI